MASKYPTRLMVRCPSCGGDAVVLRDDYAKAQMFCALDGVPLIVMGCVAGAMFPHEETPQRGPAVVVWKRNGTPVQTAESLVSLVGPGVAFGV